ncbi:MAG TPA: diaminopimelate epimerase, partial [Saprospiraceae bacterium]|nr:diaminopimelate epimerase [Saprospiraceae bacterium]
MIERLIPFEKYEGAGNDFVILDFFENIWIDLYDVVLIEKICNRHFGVGADGLIAVCPSMEYDFEMKYLNS